MASHQDQASYRAGETKAHTEVSVRHHRPAIITSSGELPVNLLIT